LELIAGPILHNHFCALSGADEGTKRLLEEREIEKYNHLFNADNEI
jgi:hypothetical protein